MRLKLFSVLICSFILIPFYLAAQSLVSIEPDSAKQGDIITVTLTGENTNWHTSPYVWLSFSGEGINTNDCEIENETTLIAEINVDDAANIGSRDVIVHNFDPEYYIGLDDGFTVIDSILPAIKAISPNSAEQGASGLEISIVGEDTEWQSHYDSIAVVFNTDYINIDSLHIINDTLLTYYITVDFQASLGPISVSILHFIEGDLSSTITKSNAFEIVYSSAQILSIDPEYAMQGDNIELTVTGLNTNWINSPYNYATVLFNTEDIVAYDIGIINSTTIEADINIAEDTPVGVYPLTLNYYVDSSLNKTLIFEDGLEVRLFSEIKDFQDKNIPEEFTITQNYPNPFNNQTNIMFTIHEHCQVTIKIYNMLGQEVITLLNKNLKPGYYNINFDAISLTSGIYIYSIRAGEQIKNQKMLLIK